MLISILLFTWAGCVSCSQTDEEIHNLWSGISVEKADITHVVSPTHLKPEELVSPTDMPEFTSHYTLPVDFMWGWAASAPQIEGAVDTDGRGPSIWDNVVHKAEGFIKTGETLDITANHYYLYKQDAMRMSEMGIPYYSMTVSWSRIMPTGKNFVNKLGLQHYIDEVEYLRSLNIRPIVTLYHWDLPQALQVEYGGWLSREIVDDFAQYARVVFEALGPYVDTWITLNEPQIFCDDYSGWPDSNVTSDVFPVPDTLTADQRKYTCGHYALLAHAKAVQILRDEIEPKYGESRISFANSWTYVLPYNNDSFADELAAQRMLEFGAGWFGNPVYIDGQYPDSLKEAYDLPDFTDEEESLILGSTDFYAWDAYTGHFAAGPADDDEDGDFFECLANPSHNMYPLCANEVVVSKQGWLAGDPSQNDWLYNTPSLFREGVLWSWKQFSPDEYFIPEIGFSVWKEDDKHLDEARYDSERVDYFNAYLHEILNLIHEDGVNLIGVMAWSALDNFEWTDGTASRFGLQYVDYKTQARYFKKSAFFFRDFFEHYIE